MTALNTIAECDAARVRLPATPTNDAELVAIFEVTRRRSELVEAEAMAKRNPLRIVPPQPDWITLAIPDGDHMSIFQAGRVGSDFGQSFQAEYIGGRRVLRVPLSVAHQLLANPTWLACNGALPSP